MHKLMLKFFKLLYNLFYALKILSVMFLIILLFYWIQHIIGANWAWTSFLSPVLDFFVNLGQSISDYKLELVGAEFEVKYFIAVLLLFILFIIFDSLEKFTSVLEDKYDDVHRSLKRAEEHSFNKNLQNVQMMEEKKIKKYAISIHTNLKKKFSHPELGHDVNKLNKELLKLLITKFGIEPVEFEGGYLFNFSNFESVDTILKLFFSIIKKDFPLEIAVCVQVDNDKYIEHLKFLKDLSMFDKIILLSETSYRYKFNTARRYSTSQIGFFQRNGENFEVFEFEEML